MEEDKIKVNSFHQNNLFKQGDLEDTFLNFIDKLINKSNYSVIVDYSITRDELREYVKDGEILFITSHGGNDLNINDVNLEQEFTKMNIPKLEFENHDYVNVADYISSLEIKNNYKMIFLNGCLQANNPGKDIFINKFNPEIYISWKTMTYGPCVPTFTNYFINRLFEGDSIREAYINTNLNNQYENWEEDNQVTGDDKIYHRFKINLGGDIKLYDKQN